MDDPPLGMSALASKVEFALGILVELDFCVLEQEFPHRGRAFRELAPILSAALRPGDVVTVKGSAGSRMGEIVRFLLAAEPTHSHSAAAE